MASFCVGNGVVSTGVSSVASCVSVRTFDVPGEVWHIDIRIIAR